MEQIGEAKVITSALTKFKYLIINTLFQNKLYCIKLFAKAKDMGTIRKRQCGREYVEELNIEWRQDPLSC